MITDKQEKEYHQHCRTSLFRWSGIQNISSPISVRRQNQNNYSDTKRDEVPTISPQKGTSQWAPHLWRLTVKIIFFVTTLWKGRGSTMFSTLDCEHCSIWWNLVWHCESTEVSIGFEGIHSSITQMCTMMVGYDTTKSKRWSFSCKVTPDDKTFLQCQHFEIFSCHMCIV